MKKSRKRIGRMKRSVTDRRGPMYPHASGKSTPNHHWKITRKLA